MTVEERTRAQLAALGSWDSEESGNPIDAKIETLASVKPPWSNDPVHAVMHEALSEVLTHFKTREHLATAVRNYLHADLEKTMVDSDTLASEIQGVLGGDSTRGAHRSPTGAHPNAEARRSVHERAPDGCGPSRTQDTFKGNPGLPPEYRPVPGPGPVSERTAKAEAFRKYLHSQIAGLSDGDLGQISPYAGGPDFVVGALLQDVLSRREQVILHERQRLRQRRRQEVGAWA